MRDGVFLYMLIASEPCTHLRRYCCISQSYTRQPRQIPSALSHHIITRQIMHTPAVAGPLSPNAYKRINILPDSPGRFPTQIASVPQELVLVVGDARATWPAGRVVKTESRPLPS